MLSVYALLELSMVRLFHIKGDYSLHQECHNNRAKLHLAPNLQIEDEGLLSVSFPTPPNIAHYKGKQFKWPRPRGEIKPNVIIIVGATAHIS